MDGQNLFNIMRVTRIRGRQEFLYLAARQINSTLLWLQLPTWLKLHNHLAKCVLVLVAVYRYTNTNRLF